jgi:hypothetical protein
MFRRSAAALMPKPESEPLLFRAERIRAKTGESGPVPRSPVPSGRKDAAFRAIFPPSSDCMLNLQTVWRMTQSAANCSLSTAKVVDALAAVDKRRLTGGATPVDIRLTAFLTSPFDSY